MKKIISILIIALSFTTISQAQDAMKKMDKETSVISLTQTPGEFVEKSITVSPGTYVFEVKNQNAGTDVGFVLVKKGADASNAENHIKTAYVTSVVKEGTTERSQQTTLSKGEYTYFCPLNKTKMNTLVVE